MCIATMIVGAVILAVLVFTMRIMVDIEGTGSLGGNSNSGICMGGSNGNKVSSMVVVMVTQLVVW